MVDVHVEISAMDDFNKFSRYLAPLAEGQRVIVMALCPLSVCSSVRLSMRVSVNFSFKNFSSGEVC